MDYTLFETDLWKVILADEQSYLGRCAVFPKRECETLSDLTSEEWTDFGDVIQTFEATLKKTFDATMFNWACMMNNAYKNGTKPQVHFHVRPRYNHDVECGGEVFQDPEFGYHYNRDRKYFVSDELRQKIFNEIKKCI